MAQERGSEELVEELLVTSRALVGIAIRSVAAATTEVTVAQHRLLMLLANSGPQSVGDIADYVGVNPSNASRQCDRLERLDLVRRARSADDRRVVQIELTSAGRRLVDAVLCQRRKELAAIVDGISDHDALLMALRELNAATSESRPSVLTGRE